jgi:hypothetical protein
MHEKCAKASGALGESCEKLAGHFGDMSKAAGGDGDMYKALSSEFAKMAKVHNEQQSYHESACQKVKSEEDELGKTLRPDHVRGIPSVDAPSEALGYAAAAGATPIPRVGAPQIAKTAAGIPAEFAHLIAFDDE